MKALELLTVSEVAEILKISYGKTLHLIKYGGLKAMKIGRQYRIKESDLISYINSSCTQ